MGTASASSPEGFPASPAARPAFEASGDQFRDFLAMTVSLCAQTRAANHAKTKTPFVSIEDCVLRHGQEWQSAPLTRDQVAVVTDAIDRSRCGLEPRQCFSNSEAVVLADRTGRLSYAEGYAHHAGVPFPAFHHGWIVVDQAHVIDLTWRNQSSTRTPLVPTALTDRTWGDYTPPTRYLGIPFDRDAIRSYMVATRQQGSLLDDPKRRFPYLTGKLAIPSATSSLSPTELAHADTIGAWQAMLDVNSNGGQGVSRSSERPAPVAFPDMARRYDQAVADLGWKYTRVPFDIARRMSSIPNETAWKAKRALEGNPPIMPPAKALAIHQRISAKRTAWGTLAGGYGNAAAAKVFAAYQDDRRQP